MMQMNLDRQYIAHIEKASAQPLHLDPVHTQVLPRHNEAARDQIHF
jgi:hypothetical protein